MADIIGPQQYSQYLRRENEGGTPMSQTSLAGGTNWSGIQGGDYADAPQAPGGQFAEQANYDNQAVSQLLNIAGKEVKKKVDEASLEAYQRGVQAAANGEAIESLHEQKVKTGFWSRLVPDKVLTLGYNDYKSYTALVDAQAEILRDKAAIEQMDPAEFNKMWVNKISSLQNGDPQHDSRLIQLSVPVGSQLFKAQAFARVEFLHEQEKNARVGATISSMQATQVMLENINPSDESAMDTYGAVLSQQISSLAKSDNETVADHQARIGASLAAAAEAGQPILFSALKASGLSASLPPETQVRMLALQDTAENNARANFQKRNADFVAKAAERIKVAGTLEEKNAIADEVDAMFGLQSGSLGVTFFDRNKIAAGAYANISQSNAAAAAFRQKYAEAQFHQETNAKALLIQREQGVSATLDYVKQRQEEAQARGINPGGPTPESIIKEGLAEQDKDQAARDKVHMTELKRQAAEAERAGQVNQLTRALGSARELGGNPATPISTRVTYVDNDGITRTKEADYDVLRSAVAGLTSGIDPHGDATIAVALHNSGNSGSKEILRTTMFSGTIGTIASGDMTLEKADKIKKQIDAVRGVPGGEEMLSDVLGRDYDKYVAYEAIYDAEISQGRKPDLRDIMRQVNQRSAGKTQKDPTRQEEQMALDALATIGITGSNGDYGAYNANSIQAVREQAAARAAKVGTYGNTPKARQQEILNDDIKRNTVVTPNFAFYDQYFGTPSGFRGIVKKSQYEYDQKAFGIALMDSLSPYIADEDVGDVNIYQTKNGWNVEIYGMNPVVVPNAVVLKNYDAYFERQKKALEEGKNITPRGIEAIRPGRE